MHLCCIGCLPGSLKICQLSANLGYLHNSSPRTFHYASWCDLLSPLPPYFISCSSVEKNTIASARTRRDMHASSMMFMILTIPHVQVNPTLLDQSKPPSLTSNQNTIQKHTRLITWLWFHYTRGVHLWNFYRNIHVFMVTLDCQLSANLQF